MFYKKCLRTWAREKEAGIAEGFRGLHPSFQSSHTATAATAVLFLGGREGRGRDPEFRQGRKREKKTDEATTGWVDGGRSRAWCLSREPPGGHSRHHFVAETFHISFEGCKFPLADASGEELALVEGSRSAIARSALARRPGFGMLVGRVSFAAVSNRVRLSKGAPSRTDNGVPQEDGMQGRPTASELPPPPRRTRDRYSHGRRLGEESSSDCCSVRYRLLERKAVSVDIKLANGDSALAGGRAPRHEGRNIPCPQAVRVKLNSRCCCCCRLPGSKKRYRRPCAGRRPKRHRTDHAQGKVLSRGGGSFGNISLSLRRRSSLRFGKNIPLPGVPRSEMGCSLLNK